MMFKSLVFGLVLLSSSSFLTRCQFTVNQDVGDDVAKQSLRRILDFLNDDTKAPYNYNSGRILRSQLKGNVLEIDLQVSLTCKANNEECDYDMAICKGVLYEPEESELQVLSVDCNPKSTIIEEPLALPIQSQICTGCLTDVNVDVKGIEPMVKTIIGHIQSEQNRNFWPLKVLRLQRQVTNGVNFVLTVQLGADRCNFDGIECIEKSTAATLICAVKFHQEPGFEAPKKIVSNNCTSSQTFTTPESEAVDLNKIDRDNPKTASHEKTVECSENDILSELMSQIIPLDKFEPTPKKDVELVQLNPFKNIESSSVHNLVDENGQPLVVSSTFQEVLATEDEPISLGTDTSNNQDDTSNNPTSTSEGASETSASISSGSTSESKTEIEVTTADFQQPSQNADTDAAPTSRESRIKRSTVNSEKFTPKEKAAIQKITDFVASTLDLIDDDNHKRVVLKVISVKKIKSDNLFLNMNLRIGVSKCAESENDVHCKRDLLNDLTKYCKVQVMIDENYGNPKVVKSHCENEKRDSQKNNRTSNNRRRRALLGGKEELRVDDPKVKKYLGEAVSYMNTKLSNGDTQFGIDKVLSASTQIVEGVSYDIKVEMSTSCLTKENSIEKCESLPKICNINVWYRPWLNSRLITIDCGGPHISFNALDSRKFEKRSILGDVTTQRSIRGGHNPVSKDDPRVKEHLEKLMPQLEQQSGEKLKLKVKQVLSATSQVVAGLNWNIKAEVIISNCLSSDAKARNECDENEHPSERVCTFKFWEKLPDDQGVRNLENVKINCDEPRRDRKTRHLVGGHTPVSTDDPRISKHLNGLLKKLDSQSDEEHKLKVKKVISATSQVVAGTNWNIKAVVVLSDCPKADEKEPKDCGDNKNNAFETVCTFKFWEKLPNKDGVRELDNIEVSCDNPKLKYQSERVAHGKGRTKRQILGGHSPVSTDDPKISEHLNDLLKKLDSQSGEEHKLKVKKVISATYQVVAGTNWNIKALIVVSDCSKADSKEPKDCGINKNKVLQAICTFKFSEKLPDKDGVRELVNIEVSCDNPMWKYRSKKDTHDEKRAKRQILGGHTPVSTDDPRISKHLNGLLKKLDSQSSEEHKLKVKKVISATSQVVAGTNWNIKALIVLSDCSKSETKEPEDCGVNKNKVLEEVCTLKFWEKLPNKDGVRELANVEISCENPNLKYSSKIDVHEQGRAKRQILGGHTAVSTDNPRITEHLNGLLKKLDSQSGKEKKFKVKKVISATSQVVAGTNWNIKALIVLSDCPKANEKESKDCGDNKNNAFETVCTFKFWEKLPNKDGVRELDNVEVSCDNPELKYKSKRENHEQKRIKRQLVGGHTSVSTDDPSISKHLNGLLKKLDSQSGEEHKLKVKKVISATSQVVAGTNWNIKAVIVLSDCPKTDGKDSKDCGDNKNNAFETVCTFKFWEKLPNKDGVRELDNVEVSCDNPKLQYRIKKDIHEQKRTKRQIPGGHNAVASDDPQLIRHLDSLLIKLDSQSGKEHKFKVKKVISATSQVVAGTNWYIKARIVLSDCPKNDGKNREICGENQNKFETTCTFEFFENLPDVNGITLRQNVKIDCDDAPNLNVRSKRDVDLIGLEQEVDKTEPKIYEYLSKSLQHIDLNSPEEYKYKVKELISASKQMVSGVLWKFKVNIILSDCSKNDITDWDQCGDLQGAESKFCTVKVWDRPWLKQGRETNITCDNQKREYTFRSKRSPKIEKGFFGQEDIELDYSLFQSFEQKYDKTYTSPKERVFRFAVFRENMKYVKLLNDHEQGTAVYGITKFADMTRKEFSKGLGYRSDLRENFENEIGFMQAEIPDIELPESFDWREKDAVAEVKNQGSCGSCWAFSTTGNIEGQYAIKYGKLLEFSEQELVDCDTVDEGCNGGLMDNAYRQIEKLGGLELETDYPYDARDEKCHFNKSMSRVQLSGAVNISSDETDMAKWLTQNGPISIAINANAMQFYMGGVSHPWKFLCNPKSLDHGVLIVGYGVHTYPKFKKSLPYWIVKNSWGPSWGEQGYYRVYRGDGTCGVNQTPSSAIVE